MIPTPAEYSGLPKRTSRGTSSASAAENFMAVRRVGRLRGAVNAADAAIATIATECLSIFEKDVVRLISVSYTHLTLPTILLV